MNEATAKTPMSLNNLEPRDALLKNALTAGIWTTPL
jgi:hypothetical protein